MFRCVFRIVLIDYESASRRFLCEIREVPLTALVITYESQTAAELGPPRLGTPALDQWR